MVIPKMMRSKEWVPSDDRHAHCDLGVIFLQNVKAPCKRDLLKKSADVQTLAAAPKPQRDFDGCADIVLEVTNLIDFKPN